MQSILITILVDLLKFNNVKIINMETKDFIEWLETTMWSRSSIGNNSDTYSEWEYERSYADCIYDSLTIWYSEKYVSVCYSNIGWGYRDVENYDFTYEEFIAWWG